MATDHNFKIKNGLTVQGATLVVNHTGDLSDTQVYIKRKDSNTNLMRWGEGTSGQSTYRFRIDQNFEFVGNSGSGDNIRLKSSDGSIQGQSYKIGTTQIIDSSRNLTNIGTITSTGRSTFDSITIDDDGSSSPLLRVVADDSSPWAFQIENSSASNSGLFQAYVNNDNNLWFRATEQGAYPTWYFQISNGSNHVTSMYLNSSGINGAGHVDVVSYKVSGTAVIDSSRNLTNIGNITTTDGKTLTLFNSSATSGGSVHLPRAGGITFYGNSDYHHGIVSRNLSGTTEDDIRINSYADVVINLDSNNNNDSNADLIIGRHGSGTGTVSQLHRISGAQGTSSSYIGTNATYSKPLLEITTSATPTQIKITTNILYSGTGSSTHAHSVTIRGFQYGSAQMADLQIGWHVYNDEFYNRNVVSSGSWAPTVTLAVENNKVVIHLASPGYWPKLYVESMYNAYGGSDQAIGWSWADAAISADANTPNQTVPYKNDFGNNVKIDSSGNFKVGNSTVITSSRELQNLNGNIRSDNTFQFLTMGGSAGRIRTRSVFAGNSYGDTPPDGSINAVNTYEQNGTTVIDNSRNLVNIGTISSGEITSSGIAKFQRDVRSAGQVRATGWWNESATTDYDGFAYEIGVSGGTAFALAYNRNNDSYGNMQFNANNFEFNNPVKISDGSNISMDANGDGQFEIAGNGYVGAIALDGSNMNIYHNSANRGLVLGTNEVARLYIDSDGDVNIFHSTRVYGASRWYVSQSDSAHQRVDVRDESTAGRAHWYGVLSDGSTSNFRHAWYTGTGYINVDANTSGIVFGGPVVANELSVPGVVTLGNTTTTPAADLRLYGTGNNYLRFRGTAGNDFEVDLQGTSATGELSFNQFNVTINNSGTLDCGPITVTSASAAVNGLVMGSSTQSNYTNIILYSNSGNGQIWKNGASGTTWGGTSSLNIYNSNGTITFHPQGEDNVVKIDNSGLHLADSSDYISLPADSNDAKIRFYSTDSSYAIGFASGQSYGGLDDWGMTFKVNDNSNRGFKWMDAAHSGSQGAMALTTQGKLTVAHSIRVGYGESDTTTPGAAYGLDINAHGQVLGRFYAQDGLLKTNRRISASQSVPIGHYSEGDQVFALDTSWTNEELQAYFNSSNVSWQADSTAPGGYAVYINGNVSVGGVYNSGFPYIPVDQDDMFYMECWIRNAGTDQRHYMGSNEYNESFSSLGGNPGSYGYWVMSNTNPGASWTKVSGYIRGFHASNTGFFENGTKYWTPQALFNYGAGTGTRACYISGWKVIRVRHKGERTFDDDMTINSRLILNNTVTNTLTLTGNGAGISFSGGNNRIFFGGYRAMEGATNGTNLQIGETYSLITLQATSTQLKAGAKLLFNGTSNYGIGAGGHNLNSGYFDTLESGSGTDALELVYYQGNRVNIGASGGNKPLGCSQVIFGNTTSRSISHGTGYNSVNAVKITGNWNEFECMGRVLDVTNNNCHFMDGYGSTNHATHYLRIGSGGGGNGGLDHVHIGCDLNVTGNVTAYYSDARLKQNVETIPNALEILKGIRGVTFEWNELAESVWAKKQGEKDFGMIAQEVEAVFPMGAIVQGNADKNKEIGYADPESPNYDPLHNGELDEPEYKTIKYDKMVTLAIQAIKEQQEKIEKLEELVEKLISEK